MESYGKILELMLWMRLFEILNMRYSFTADVIGHLMLSLLAKGDFSSHCYWNCHWIPFSSSDAVSLLLGHCGRLRLSTMGRFPRCWATGLFQDYTTLSFPTRKWMLTEGEGNEYSVVGDLWLLLQSVLPNPPCASVQVLDALWPPHKCLP